MQEPLLEWMNVFLNSREIHNSLFTMRYSKTKFRSCELHTFSMHLIFSLPFTYFISHTLILRSENTSWLFIEKTIITACNQLNIQCNWLFQRSNRLYYHFNRFKCSSHIWKTSKNNVVGSNGLGIIKKGGVELIINVPWLIKNLSFLMLLDSIRLYY